MSDGVGKHGAKGSGAVSRSITSSAPRKPAKSQSAPAIAVARASVGFRFGSRKTLRAVRIRFLRSSEGSRRPTSSPRWRMGMV